MPGRIIGRLTVYYLQVFDIPLNNFRRNKEGGNSITAPVKLSMQRSKPWLLHLAIQCRFIFDHRDTGVVADKIFCGNSLLDLVEAEYGQQCCQLTAAHNILSGRIYITAVRRFGTGNKITDIFQLRYIQHSHLSFNF